MRAGIALRIFIFVTVFFGAHGHVFHLHGGHVVARHARHVRAGHGLLARGRRTTRRSARCLSPGDAAQNAARQGGNEIHESVMHSKVPHSPNINPVAGWMFLQEILGYLRLQR